MTATLDLTAESYRPRVVALLGGFVTVGGAERMTIAALETLVRNGSDVHCIVNDWENHRIIPEVERIGATWSIGSYSHRLRLRNRRPLQILRGVAGIVPTSLDLARVIKRFKPDLILSPDFDMVLRNSLTIALVRSRGVPVLLYLHNTPADSNRYRKLFTKIIDPLVACFATVSKYAGETLRTMGIDSSKIRYVNNFADIQADDREGIERNRNLVVFAGQIIPHKGLDILLEAMSLVARNYPAARLEILGRIDGWIAPEYQAFREAALTRATEPDLRAVVSFLGWRTDVPAVFLAAAVHCSPSRPEMNEGMPLVCLEAKAAGIPTVAPATGPFQELIEHGIDGWLCDPLTPESIADALGRYFSDHDAARRAGNAARRSSQKFSRTEFERRWICAVGGARPANGWCGERLP